MLPPALQLQEDIQPSTASPSREPAAEQDGSYQLPFEVDAVAGGLSLSQDGELSATAISQALGHMAVGSIKLAVGIPDSAFQNPGILQPGIMLLPDAESAFPAAVDDAVAAGVMDAPGRNKRRRSSDLMQADCTMEDSSAQTRPAKALRGSTGRVAAAPSADEDGLALQRNLLQLIVAAGEDGLELEALKEQLEQGSAGEAPAASSTDVTAGTSASDDEIAAALEALVCSRRVRKIHGFDVAMYVSAEHSHRFVLHPLPPGFKPLASRSKAAPGAAGNAAAATAAGPSQGTASDAAAGGAPSGGLEARPAATGGDAQDTVPQQAVDAPTVPDPAAEGALQDPGEPELLMRPWLDHRGHLNRPYFEALSRRVCAIVAKHPGIPESVLVNQLSLVNPENAIELVRMMANQGCLQRRQQQVRAARPPAIFASRKAAAEQVQGQQMTLYFPVVQECFSVWVHAQPPCAA